METGDHNQSNGGGEVSVFETSQKPPKQRPKWLKPLVIFFMVAVVATGIWFLALSGSSEETNQEELVETETTQTTQPQINTSHPSELLYAYKERSTTNVRSLNWKDKSKTDVFEIDEDVEITDTGNYFSALGPSVDYDPLSQEFVFIDTGGLKLYDRTDKSGEKLINKVDNFATELSTPDWSVDLGSVYSIFTPMYSPDGSLVSFEMGHYEGSSAAVFDLSTKALAPLGDTFVYVNLVAAEPLAFSKVEGNENLQKSGNFASRYLETKGALVNGQGVFSPDGKKVALSIAPVSERVEEYIPEGSDTQLVVVDLDTMEHTFLGAGVGYNTSLAFSADGEFLYTVKQIDSVSGEFVIEKWSTVLESLVFKYEIKQSYAVAGEYSQVDLYGFEDGVYASVKTKVGSEYNIVVIDVDAQEQLANFLVDRVSAFKILYAKR